MRILLAAAATTALLMAGPAFAKDRDVKTNHDLSGFDEIEVIGVYDLDIRVGEGFSVRTEANQRNADRLRVEVSGDTLVLSVKEDEDRKWGGNSQQKSVLAIITLPTLTSLEVTGVATGSVEGIDGGNLDVAVAGVVGDLELDGRCERLTIDLAGVGELDAEDLVCQHVEATLGGVGELIVHATQSIEADAGGIGEIEVHGDPEDRDVDDGFMAKVKFR